MTTELPDTHPTTPAPVPLALKSNEGLGPARTEWTEIRLALRQEYGHPYTYNGVPCVDFSKHVYVGRACALLLKAEKQEAALKASTAETVAAEVRKERERCKDLVRRYMPAGWSAVYDAMADEGPNVRANRRP